MAIEIDYYITMVSKNNELVNLKGSSVNLPAHGWCGARARKNNAAKNSVRPRKNTAEGGCGGNSAVFLQKIEASPAMGIEPTTFRMPCERSAAELPARR
ncbi:MAG: hypothetical protein G01um10143_5 [Parcubacteria group bacterium Gr01-1014_3]|nr:MAG: hypothetical protein G01um10143_5 [Parcubacteria group bacterium Gr01-1014_3]